MNQHTSPSTDQHQQVLLLLPWYLNQSLEPNERVQVESHLHSCVLCSRELLVLRKLAAAVKQSSNLDVAAEVSFAGLRAKLQTAEPVRQDLEHPISQPAPAWFGKRANADPGMSGNAANGHNRLMRLSGSTVIRFAIAAAMLLAIVPLTMKYVRSPFTPDYYTLSAVKPESSVGTKLRVVFSNSFSDAGINSLLDKINGQLVDGPNSIGAYTVKLNAGKDSPDLTATIAFLRNQQKVILVEPVIDH